jgi:uncharacterized protein with HEPN domain
MSVQDDKTRVQHMLDASRKIVAFTRDANRQTLGQDEILQLALVRLIEIVGEAATRISPALQTAHPEIPWAAITGCGIASFTPILLWTWTECGKRSRFLSPH